MVKYRIKGLVWVTLKGCNGRPSKTIEVNKTVLIQDSNQVDLPSILSMIIRENDYLSAYWLGIPSIEEVNDGKN